METEEKAEIGLGLFDMLVDDIEPDDLANEIGNEMLDAGIPLEEGVLIGQMAIEAFTNAKNPQNDSKFKGNKVYIEMLKQLASGEWQLP